MIVLSKNKPKGIIWIASYPRSGNTWTRAFINTLAHIIRDPNFKDVDINKIEEGSAAESKAELYTQLLGKPAHRATDAEIASVRPRVQAGIVALSGVRSSSRPTTPTLSTTAFRSSTWGLAPARSISSATRSTSLSPSPPSAAPPSTR